MEDQDGLIVSQLIDLPANQATSRQSSPDKGKAPKKKPRTITDIATEQYQTRAAELDASNVASEFFQPRTTVTKVPLNNSPGADGAGLAKKPPRRRSTSKQDSEKASSRAKSKKLSAKSTAKPKVVAEKLLSPSSALMRMNKQDILFGTSSQLALEESPMMVRQLQHALRESEVEADRSLHQLLPPPPRWPKLDKAIGKRGLWDASSRDVEGGLLEQMEDVYIPDFDRTQEYPLLMDGTNDDCPADSSFVDIDNVELPPPVIISSDAPTPPRTTAQAPLSVPATSHRTALSTSMMFFRSQLIPIRRRPKKRNQLLQQVPPRNNAAGHPNRSPQYPRKKNKYLQRSAIVEKQRRARVQLLRQPLPLRVPIGSWTLTRSWIPRMKSC
jgi:hypothetical protein